MSPANKRVKKTKLLIGFHGMKLQGRTRKEGVVTFYLVGRRRKKETKLVSKKETKLVSN